MQRRTFASIALAGAALCAGASAHAQKPVDTPCDPPVPELHLPDATTPGGAEATLANIFAADQADRDALMKDGTYHADAWPAVAQHDLAHRKTVLELLRKQRVRSGNEVYLAAFVFQHGGCPAHFRFASELAQSAIARGSEKAKWLYAAALDRYLLMSGKPQKFGTQFQLGDDGKPQLAPLDPATTDVERAAFNVPALKSP